VSKSTAEVPETPVPQYTYEQLLREKRGIDHDVWGCALNPRKQYTIEQAEAAVAAYLAKEVKK
jgi:hypothetical protein